MTKKQATFQLGGGLFHWAVHALFIIFTCIVFSLYNLTLPHKLQK